jgi:hypothetical protein
VEAGNDYDYDDKCYVLQCTSSKIERAAGLRGFKTAKGLYNATGIKLNINRLYPTCAVMSTIYDMIHRHPRRFRWWTWHICLSAYEMRALAISSLRPRQPHEKPITLIGLHASSRARTMLFSSPARAPAVSESTLRQDELLDDRLPATHACCRPIMQVEIEPWAVRPHSNPRTAHPDPASHAPKDHQPSLTGKGWARGKGEPGALHAGPI